MNNRYSHLLSPLKIGNVVLKNRMLFTNALPHFLQGPETFPSDAVISFYSNIARNGAAVVTCIPGGDIKPRKGLMGDFPHNLMLDIEDPAVQNCFSMMADAIHFYDSKAMVSIKASEPKEFDISDRPASDPGEIFPKPSRKEIPIRLIQEMIINTVNRAKLYQSLGFDMISIHMSYRSSIMANVLSPAINKRTDQYGGSVENRARINLELCRAIKKACGQDFIIEAQLSGEDGPDGYTLADTIAYAKIWEDVVDIIQLRGYDGSTAHPTGFNSQKIYPLTLHYAQAIKEAGVKMITAPVGGFQDLDLNEEYIATGKTDMIAMARGFICDSEYGKKAYEGRGEDVVPCIRCNKCHVLSMTGPWNSICSVNPTVGIAHRVNRMIDPPGTSRKIAIIGGGPAGMKAAIIAAERGHKVTLYEKNYFLGGQLRHADFASFKWPLRNFKDYLIRQLYKAGVEVLLSTEVTPGIIKAKGYDVVIVAAGAEPITPDIPGANGNNVWKPIDVYGKDQSLGKNVVVIGGAQIGVETGMYLAENGHKVTVLTRQKELATDATPIHYREIFEEAWKALDNFSYITEATTTAISNEKVTYVDAKGKEKFIKTDSVVVSAGLSPRHDEALKFYGTAERFFIIGDCRAVSSVQACMRSAFATASLI
jgi:2,4-dienoyl-CoA reductase-like NADH-dependent reductase (Old Yellow Enzyme family)/thioredoxin reductase